MQKRRISPRGNEEHGKPFIYGDGPSNPFIPTQPKSDSGEGSLSWLADYLSQFSNGSSDPNHRGYGDDSTSSTRGGTQQPTSTTWSQWLQNLGVYDQYSSLLAGLGFDLNASPTDAQMSDWQKQLMDMILQHIADQENRQYSQSVLQEQRNYDSPLNQLLRMTGAGIGRDAAIQALSGVQQPTVGAQATIPQGIMPSESAANDLNNKLGIANSVFNAFGSLGSLVNAGVSLSSAIPQIQALQAANYMSDQQKIAYNSTRNFAQALGALTSSGALSLDAVNSCSNADDLANLIRSSANPSVQQLAGSQDFSNVFNTPFGREQMNRYWSAVRDSRDAGTLLDEFIKSSKLQNILSNMDIRKAGAELENIQLDSLCKTAQQQETLARIVLIGAQTEQVNALTSLTNEQVEFQQLTNDNLRLDYELNKSGFPILKQIYLDELGDELSYWSLMKDPQQRESRIQRWVMEERNANRAEYLNYITLNAAGSFAEEHPYLWYLASGFKELGVNKYAQKAKSKVSSVTHAFLKYVPK